MAVPGSFSEAEDPREMPPCAAPRNLGFFQYSSIVAALLLALMGWLMFSGARGDSVTFDEQPHVAAGYTYLTRRSLDFNVEHPPLIKDLAATPLLFMHLDLSWDVPDWYNGDPWEFGRKLLDHSTPDPDDTLLAVRLPLIAVTLALGWLLFSWTRSRAGDAAGLIALLLFVFSPTILAHGRLVTTDVGAAGGYFLALTAFLKFLRLPTAANILLAGAALGFALLTKFSTFLLAPIFLVLAVAWWWLNRTARTSESPRIPIRPRRGLPMRIRRGTLLLALPRFRPAGRQARPIEVAPSRLTLARVAAVIVIGMALVYLVYAHHIHNLPPDRQLARTKFSLTGRGVGNTPKDMVLWMVERPAFRPLAAYFSGMIQTMIRSAQGGGVYLLGEFHPQGVRQYFPLVYLMKEPAALHLLTLLALLLALAGMARKNPQSRWRDRLRENFPEMALLVTAVLYWALSVRSNLNIGVRHLAPVLPMTFALVGIALARWLRGQTPPRARMAAATAVALALAWQTASVLRASPYHMAYFNEFAGGPENGWQHAIDSNADWGQDMGRLARFVEQRGIGRLWLDYFGSADANRYLSGKWEAINGCSEPRHGWVAVSVMSYQNSASNPACDYRRWLTLERLTAKVGYSTLIFRVE